jgi:hypothetical protein
MLVVGCEGSGLCDERITLSEKPYQVCVRVRLIVCYLETSNIRCLIPNLGCWVIENNYCNLCEAGIKKKVIYFIRGAQRPIM